LTIGLSLVLISPEEPGRAQELRDWADFVHIRHIAEVGVPGYCMITPYENATGADPRFLHFYEMDDDDMTRAVERLGELGGGIVVVDGGEVKAELPLPVAGLLADAPLAKVIEKSLACNDAAREVGWSGATPFLTLSFLGLSVIPSLKITDRGLVDVDRFQIVPLKL